MRSLIQNKLFIFKLTFVYCLIFDQYLLSNKPNCLFAGDVHQQEAGLLPQPSVQDLLLGAQRQIRQQRIFSNGNKN